MTVRKPRSVYAAVITRVVAADMGESLDTWARAALVPHVVSMCMTITSCVRAASPLLGLHTAST
jgi:hypothetical protein